MSDQSKLGLGQIIPTGPFTQKQQRDAIHVAVAPVVAAHRISPGMHLGIDRNGEATNRTIKSVGVADPYLKQTVLKGETFWLFLYPGSITSLRHDWTHPAFEPETKESFLAERSSSELWMRQWAMENMTKDYYGDGTITEDMAYAAAIDAGHRMSVGPHEDARDHIDDTWWNHWEIITGERGKRDEYFSCAC
jgi:hypothetical protein